MTLLLLVYLVLGAAAGVVAGLFGIGGGILIVPALVIVFTSQGMPVEVLTHSAVATSLATIVVTSISSILAHHKRGAIEWGLFRPLALGLMAGAVIGVQVAHHLAGNHLQIIIGVFVLLVSLQMMLSLQPPLAKQVAGVFEVSSVGIVIGSLSSLFGVGGGTLTVPYLSWRRVAMQRAVATSAACGFPIALIGALTNVSTGWGHPDLMPWSVGYVYLPAFIGIVLTSALCAKQGARLAHKLSERMLKKVFAAFLACVGCYFLLSNL